MSEPLKETAELTVDWIEPQYVDIVWDRLIEGFDRAIGKSDNEVAVSTLKKMVTEAGWLLHVIYEGEEILGAGIVEPLAVEGGFWLNVPFGFSIDPVRTDVLDAFFQYVEDKARENGALGVKMASARRGFMKRMRHRGYRQRLVEFVLRFEKDEGEDS